MLEQMFEGEAVYFAVPALLGTSIFVLRMAMMLMGGGDMDAGHPDLGGHADIGHSGLDIDSEPIDHGGTNSDSAFQLISLQSIAAFLMGAGWGGIAADLGFGLSLGWSLLSALGSGIAMLYLFAWLMKAVYDMQSSGNIDPRQLVGREALVDVEIPSARGGQGTVRVIIDDRMRRYAAITEGQTLHRGLEVQIDKLNSDNTVTVTRR